MVNQTYDPFVTIAAAADAARKHQQAQQREEAKAREWDAAWQAVVQQRNVDRLLELGCVMQSHEAAFWLERLECEIARTRYVVEVRKLAYYQFWANVPVSVICLRLLKGAFLGSAEELSACIQKIDVNLAPAVADKMIEIRDQMSEQVRGILYPPTPPMTRTEFAQACRGNLPGFDKSGITKKVESGELILKQSFGPPRRAFHTFEVRCPRENRQPQLDVLKLAVAQIRKCKKTGFFSEAVWSA
jgi:hypothetical protein